MIRGQAPEPTRPQGEASIIDVHAHYLPLSALELMGSEPAVVGLERVCGVDDNVTLNHMPVGTVIERLTSVDTMLAEMDATGVDRRVLSPPPFTYRYWESPTNGLRLCRLLNDATAEVAAKHPDRFSALCTVPLQAPDLAIAELGRAVDEVGMVGISLGTMVDGKHLDDESVTPLLAAAEERGLPILVHPDFVPNSRMHHYYLINLIGLPTETATTIAHLILSGTLERFPALRICFVHGGGSLPYLLGRLDWGWKVRPETRANVVTAPRAHLGNIFFDTLTHDPVGLRFLIDSVGADRVVVGTDAPFDVADPDPVGHVSRCPGITDRETDRILHHSSELWLTGESTAANEGAAV